MSTQNEERYRWLADQVWNRGNLAALEEGTTEDVRAHDSMLPRRGRAAWREVVSAMRAAFADIRYEVHETIGVGDRVAARWTLTARHVGSFRGIAPSGNSVRVQGVSFSRFVDGKLAESHIGWDGLQLLEQIGAPHPQLM